MKKIIITTAELKSLEITPLAIAKYFYSKGITSHLFIQKLIYFAFLEGLKDNLLFFGEKFQAWKHGPVLRTVFDEMTSCSDLDEMFASVTVLKRKEVINICEQTYQTYQNWEVWDVVDKSHEGPWQKTRAGLSEEEISTQEIELKELVNFANAGK